MRTSSRQVTEESMRRRGSHHGVRLLVDFLLLEGRPAALLGGAVGEESASLLLEATGMPKCGSMTVVGRRDDDDLVLIDFGGTVCVCSTSQQHVRP